MSLPVTRQGASAATNIPEGFSRSEGKTLMRMQNAEIAHGLVAATRVQAAAMVATVALQTSAMLSREASFQSDGDPATANRLNHIVDTFAVYAGSEVSRLGL